MSIAANRVTANSFGALLVFLAILMFFPLVRRSPVQGGSNIDTVVDWLLRVESSYTVSDNHIHESSLMMLRRIERRLVVNAADQMEPDPTLVFKRPVFEGSFHSFGVSDYWSRLDCD